jgi:hypothetical protein
MKPKHRFVIVIAYVLAIFLGGDIALAQTPSLSLSVTPTGGTASRALQSKLGDSLSLLDFGAACNATLTSNGTDDTAAINAALATGKPISIPAGLICYTGSLSQYQVAGIFTGPGKLKTSDGNTRGPYYVNLNTAPNPGAVTIAGQTGCNSGISCWATWNYLPDPLAIEWNINDVSGGHTMGAPQSGSTGMPGAAPVNLFLTNSSGYNYSPSGNGGRTGVNAFNVVAQNNGQGDMGVYGAQLNCGGNPVAGQTGTKVTNFLAAPSCGVMGGNISALAPDQYLQDEEWHFNDQGYDISAIGKVMGYIHTATDANSASLQGATNGSGQYVFAGTQATLSIVGPGDTLTGPGFPSTSVTVLSTVAAYNAIQVNANSNAVEPASTPYTVSFQGTLNTNGTIAVSSTVGRLVGWGLSPDYSSGVTGMVQAADTM